MRLDNFLLLATDSYIICDAMDRMRIGYKMPSSNGFIIIANFRSSFQLN